MKTCVKICGITNIEDAGIAAESGADLIGVIIDIEYSPRCVSIETASDIINASSVPVIVLMEKTLNEIETTALKVKPHGVQIVGGCSLTDIKQLKNRTGCAVWKTVHLPQNSCGDNSIKDLHCSIEKYHTSGVDVVVLDTMVGKKKGGTGQTCDWSAAARIVDSSPVPIVLAGGITPANAVEAINAVQPYGIDLSSGVEKTPGRKDPERIAELMHNIQLSEKMKS